ncbi:MAG: hypothetical protein RIS26_1070 [Actinomycetota bacterium]|jgi:RNA polymerase subunit RPABC4/transcription elongation factor Spt4
MDTMKCPVCGSLNTHQEIGPGGFYRVCLKCDYKWK